MASASLPNLCAICETIAEEQKPKVGILHCLGCQKYFCARHIADHRQYLTDLLENTVVNERNALQDKISTLYEQQWSTDIQAQFDIINKWELNTIELI
ncbi:hypothetical protein I4U23_015584 [Adineta vaga]|nr:hypothetical protein I4U23_015584 [Adineta vaga]